MTLRTAMRFGDFSKNISKPLDRRIKRYPECDKPDRYELEIGTNCGTVPDSAHFYRLTGLDREDIRCLYTCVTRFIENAEDLYNLRLKLRWDREKHNKRIDGEVLMCMGVEEIAEDFCDSILVKTVTMLDDFGTMEVSDLCEKYGEYIDNRYYMYREERRFEMPEDVLPGEGVKPYVEEVVQLLKSKI